MVLLVSVLLALSFVEADIPVTASSGPTVANGWNVLSTIWGTSTTPASPGPGSQDVTMTVNLQYYFANTATNVQLSLTLPSGFTDTSGNSVAVAFVTGSVTSGSTVTATFVLNISPTVSVGVYSFPLAINWAVAPSTQTSVSLVQYATATANLRGKVQLTFQVQQTSLLAGQVNTIGLVMSNVGTGTPTQIVTTVTAPSTISVLTAIPTVASLAPNTNTTTTVKVFVSSSAAGSAIAISFTASYLDSYSNSATITQSVGFYATTFSEPVLSFSTNVVSLRSGQVDDVATTLTNLGPGTASAIRVAASGSGGLSVLSQFPLVTSLQAGGTTSSTLEVFVPASSAGTALTLTFAVTFTDANGNVQSATEDLGFYALPAAEPTLSFTAPDNDLTPGELNSIVITLTDAGPGAASSVATTVSAPSGFSVLSQFPQVASIQAGGTVSATLQVFVPVAAAATLVTLTLTVSFTDSSGNQQSSTQTIGLYASPVAEPVLTFVSDGGPLTPGQVNSVPVSLTNYGPGPVTSVRATVSASGGLSVLNQFPQVASLQPGHSVNATLQVFAPVSSSGSAVTLTFGLSFLDQNGNLQSSTQDVGLYASNTVSISNAISLMVTTPSNSITAGVQSSVRFVIENNGQVPIYAPTISLTASSPLVVTANSTVILAGVVVKPGSSVTYTAAVTAGAGSTGGVYTAALSVAFTDQLGESHSQTFPVAFVVTVPVIQVSASSVQSQINIGKSSQLSFVISNSGTAPIYSPSFSLSAPAGFAVVTNSTVLLNGVTLAPGQRVRYGVNVTAGPKTAEGAYVATLTVSYTDQFGNSHSSSFSMGVVAIGVIEMVLQNEQVTSSGTTYSVSGTLLNEGVDNAYYLEATANVMVGTKQLGTASTYVGEVDVNTPLPVSLVVTVPSSALASANGTGTLVFVASYQNDYGQTLEYKASQRLTLPRGSSSSGSFTGGSSSTGTATATASQPTVSSSTVDIVRYGALIGIVAAVLVTVIYVRRGRSRGGGGGTRRRKPEVY